MKKNLLLVGSLYLALGLATSVLLSACGLLGKVTPADRAAGYTREAQAAAAACKAYKFDRSVGLVGEVPAMAELCK